MTKMGCIESDDICEIQEFLEIWWLKSNLFLKHKTSVLKHHKTSSSLFLKHKRVENEEFGVFWNIFMLALNEAK